jgi:hypothetical protein
MKKRGKVTVEKVEIIPLDPETQKLADKVMEALRERLKEDEVREQKMKERKRKSKNDYR